MSGEKILVVEDEEDIQELVNEDRNAYVIVMKRLGVNPWYIRPIAIVSSDFLDGPVTALEAASELGVDLKHLQTSFQNPGHASRGLAPHRPCRKTWSSRRT